ncbi:MAG: hypothetical protein HYS27_11810 [Deltaproteobacteria bacterium]|nr:hypothetical protein [Deltaproteobacteria bacterium]
MIELNALVNDVALAIKVADGKSPQAVNARTKVAFQPGFGPHAEMDAVRLICETLVAVDTRYTGKLTTGVPYPEAPRQKCDLCVGSGPQWDWCIEVKMLRFLGDNGLRNDNILMHILSPYPEDRSALTDIRKLGASKLVGRKAILLYGFDHDDISLDPAIEAFERLAPMMGTLGPRATARFDDLVHPHHRRGRVFGWEIVTAR